MSPRQIKHQQITHFLLKNSTKSIYLEISIPFNIVKSILRNEIVVAEVLGFYQLVWNHFWLFRPKKQLVGWMMVAALILAVTNDTPQPTVALILDFYTIKYCSIIALLTIFCSFYLCYILFYSGSHHWLTHMEYSYFITNKI